MPGKTSLQYDASSSTPARSSVPTAQTIGPTVIGSRGPVLAAMTDVREDSSSITTGIGRVATPAAIASYPAVTWSWSTRKKSTAPRAPYTSSVIRLAALNTREANIESGAIAPGRLSSTTNAAIDATLTTSPAATTHSGRSRQDVSR